MVSGAVSGLVPGLILTLLFGPVGVAVGVGCGLGLSLLFQPKRDIMTAGIVGAAFGVPLWLIGGLTVLPLLTAGGPQWAPAAIRDGLPSLGLWLISGSLLGASTGFIYRTAERYLSDGSTPSQQSDPTRVVILGGGFGGLYAAKRLEELFGPTSSVDLTIVSRDNATLFTPMLPEVAGGSLVPRHITTPLRAALKRTSVIEAAAIGLNTDQQHVQIDYRSGPRGWADTLDATESAGESATEELEYDHLVVTLGAVPSHKGIDPEREFVLDFKSLGDAMHIRNHIIACFEQADAIDDSDERQKLTRFVIAGGGFAGVELAGAVNDLAHGLLDYYPTVSREDIEVIVVHSRERILPALSEELATYAREQMRERGVIFELGTRVTEASHGSVELSDGRNLESETMVWTAGNRPHPLVDESDLPQDDGGGVAVDEKLSVPGLDGVWAAGDCAAVYDAETGERHPNTAQHAIRAGATVAQNVHATTTGDSPDAFTYQSQGTLAVIGHQVAVAEVMNQQFSGRIAWLLWRGIYLFKLPGLAQKVRVALSWGLELFFPRDLVRTIDTPSPQSGNDTDHVGAQQHGAGVDDSNVGVATSNPHDSNTTGKKS